MGQRGKVCARAAAMLAATLFSAGALAEESAGALYGDLRLSLDYAEDNSAATGPSYASTDNNSVWGVKASTLRGGVTVFGAYERFIDNDDPALPNTPVEFTRLAYLGLSSFCGTLKFGRHPTAYAEAGRKLDPFYNTAVAGAAGIAGIGSMFRGGNSHGSSTAFNADFLGNAISANHFAYQTPAYYGVTGNVAMIVDETQNADQDHDYGAGVEYRGHGVTAGAQYLDVNGANDATWGAGIGATRLHAGYAGDRFGVGATVEWIDLPAPGNDADYLMVSGWYGVREDTRIAASFGLENDSATDGDSLRFGVFHDVIDGFTVWVAARRYNERVAANPDADAVTLGASYKFSLGFGPT